MSHGLEVYRSMIDPYTKAVLAVILVALVAINLNHTIRPAIARSDGCGGYPCWVYVKPQRARRQPELRPSRPEAVRRMLATVLEK